MHIPVCRKINYIADTTVERKLPIAGDIVVKKGDTVLPFTKVGRVRVSKEYILLPDNIKLGKNDTKNNDGEKFLYSGEVIGKSGLFNRIKAPYNGYILFSEGKKYFMQEKKDAWIFSGVWGVVEDVVNNSSVAIRTQLVDINFVASTNKVVMGEFIVFPNPAGVLDLEYLRNFAKNIQGKIVYIGHSIRPEVYKAAVELNVGGLVAGSIDSSLYSKAKSGPVSVGVTTGFGHLETPEHIFEFLKTISSRHVFLNGEQGKLQIPVPTDVTINQRRLESALVEAVPNMEVMIIGKNHFGKAGVIESVQDDFVRVKLNKSNDIVQVQMPNVLALI